MKAICATDLSAASEATIENETCLECLGRIGVEEIHLVTVISSNVHAGMPGMDFEKRREQALGRYRRVIEDAGFDVESHVVAAARPTDASTGSQGRSVPASRSSARGERARSRTASSARPRATSHGRRSSRCWSTGSNARRTSRTSSANTCFSGCCTRRTSRRTPSGRSRPSRTSVTRRGRPRWFTSKRRRIRNFRRTPTPTRDWRSWRPNSRSGDRDANSGPSG